MTINHKGLLLKNKSRLTRSTNQHQLIKLTRRFPLTLSFCQAWAYQALCRMYLKKRTSQTKKEKMRKPLSFSMPCRWAIFTFKASDLEHKQLTRCGRRHSNSWAKTTCSTRLSLTLQGPISTLLVTFNCLQRKLPRKSDQQSRQFIGERLIGHWRSNSQNKEQ